MHRLPKISEFMDQVVPTLGPDMQIMKAVDYLLRHRVTGAPVVDATGRLVGIITETDLLKLLHREPQPKEGHRRLGEELAVDEHVDVHRQEHEEHRDDAPACENPGPRHKDHHTEYELRHSAESHHDAVGRNVRRHDRQVEIRIEEVIDASPHVEGRHHVLAVRERGRYDRISAMSG